MAKTQVKSGFGSVLEIALASAPTSFTYIAETISNSPPSFTDATIEATHSQSPGGNREYIAGPSDPGSSSHEMNHIPGSPADVFIESIRGKNLVVHLTFPNGRKKIWGGVREGYEISSGIDNRDTATLTIKVSGQPTTTPVAAPRNLVTPTIDNTAPVVGAPIICDQEIWAGASSYTYQWQADGVNISGATFASYVPSSDDIGAVLTCEVTGYNESFTTTAETAATTAVAAS